MDQQVVKVKLTAGVRNMNHAQKYLAQANRHIAELAVQSAHQRAIVKHAFNTGQRSEMAESLLDALEESLRIFEKHRIFLLGCSGSSLRPGDGATGRGSGLAFLETQPQIDCVNPEYRESDSRCVHCEPPAQRPP
jgi:hypothetical protein